MKKTLTGILLLFAFLASCSSPESDGKKAAQKTCDCIDEYAGKLNKAYESYIEKFNSYSFKTRIEAREKISRDVQEVEDEFIKSEEKSAAYRDKLNGKYLTNRENAIKFQYAYNTQYAAYSAPSVDTVTFQSRINSLVQTIIPPKPDLEKLKKGLIGRKIAEGIDGYRGRDWYWEIKSPNDLKSVEIKNAENRGDDYLLDVHIILRGENTDYEADVKIVYVLRQYDDWTIDIIETQNMQIVQTHRYDNCISVKLSNDGLEVNNQCDVALLIGGSVLLDHYGEGIEWKKFSQIAAANQTTYFFLGYGKKQDYKIQFIERP